MSSYLREKAKQSGDHNLPLVRILRSWPMKNTVLEEAMDNLKEAGQRIRATQSLMRSEGMIDGVGGLSSNCRQGRMGPSTSLRDAQSELSDDDAQNTSLASSVRKSGGTVLRTTI
jgi:hypothetical protein